MKDVVALIAGQITKYRKQAGLTKKELSQVLGVAPSTVSGGENGDYAPSADTRDRKCVPDKKRPCSHRVFKRDAEIGDKAVQRAFSGEAESGSGLS